MLRRIRNRKSKGFTLIELMIVVAIIGILAAIAIPNFLNMRKKAMSTEAKSNLGDLRTMEEAYRMEYGTYTASLTNIDYSQPAGARYTYSVASANAANTTLVADGNAGEPVAAEVWHLVITAGVAGQPALQ